jgi:hypothetical protein
LPKTTANYRLEPHHKINLSDPLTTPSRVDRLIKRWRGKRKQSEPEGTPNHEKIIIEKPKKSTIVFARETIKKRDSLRVSQNKRANK